MPPLSSTKLDMYLAEATRPLFRALEDWMREGWDDSIPDPEHDVGFAFGQICGIDFAKADPGTYSYLATLTLADEAVPPGHYHSVLITPHEGGLGKLEEFDPAEHKVAINELPSFSGSIVFSSHMLGRGDAIFPDHVFSGGHINSINMVAEGEVKLAAIDRLSFNMASHQWPELFGRIRSIGQTGNYPGLPFVVPGHFASGKVELIAQRLLGFAETAAFREYAPRLGVDGIIRLDPAQYTRLAMI